ncbi:hypothetical protein [Staphylococcus delphini]|uniref:hypothetical protein n=1 Tax=Staphylococcus delphini TaxID=53344 RepID=UPI001CCDCED3|nr:hypothetical protein [Staphylococcus delphini]MBZ8174742.1 hypothetical protein [Staphylococcus delphini]
MSVEVISLSSLINNFEEDEVKSILNTFESRDFSGSDSSHEVESFLKEKAIYYDKNDFSKTHLIFSSYKGNKILIGYYSIGINSIRFTKKQLSRYSSKLKGQLKNKANKNDKETGNIELTCYLIGQIGKNFKNEAIKSYSLNGAKILELAYQTILEAQSLTGGSFVYLEYEDTDKLRNMYKNFGFKELPDFRTQNGLCLAIMRIK